MTEGEVVEQLIGYMSLLLLGVSIIFTVVSTYIIALNYFVGDAQFIARLGAFAFVSLILALLLVVMLGAESTHAALIARLAEFEASGEISAHLQAAAKACRELELARQSTGRRFLGMPREEIRGEGTPADPSPARD